MQPALLRSYVVTGRPLFVSRLLNLVFYFVIAILARLAFEEWLGIRLPYHELLAFMSEYTEQDRQAYWIYSLFFGGSYAAFSVILILSPLHASLGKAASGLRLISVDGCDPKPAQCLKRAALQSAYLGLLILPGPLLGFSYGPGSEGVSLLFLGLGIATVVLLLFLRDDSGRLFHDRFAATAVMRRRDVETFRSAMTAAR